MVAFETSLMVLEALVYYLSISFISILIIVVIIGKLWFEPKSGVCRCKTKLHGKTALVTGGNSGIGLETARDLARRGARVIIACRNEEKSNEAIADIIATTGNTNVEYRNLDLCKFKSVRKFADHFNNTVDRLDFLVNNAGFVDFSPRISDDGLDAVLQTNHFGPFLLTNLLLDKLIASKPSKIVILSSFMHNFGYLDINDLGEVKNRRGCLLKYPNSKLCNLLWTKALAKRLPNGVTVNAVHPGFVRTGFFDNHHPCIKRFILLLTSLMFKNSSEGAQTSIHLCVSPDLKGITGGYFKDCKQHVYRKLCDNEEFVEDFWNKCVLLTSNK